MGFNPTDLAEHGPRSLVRCPTPGFDAYDRDALIEVQPPDERDAYAEEADAWVADQGGRRFAVARPPSLGLWRGRFGQRLPGPAREFYELPPDAIP
jgi:hypothetical protein